MTLQGWDILFLAFAMWTCGCLVGAVIANGVNERRQAERARDRRSDDGRLAGMLDEARTDLEQRAQPRAAAGAR